MRCCYPVSSGRTGCGAGWCRQAPNTAQTPSHPIITQTRPIQLHFPCFQRTIVVLTTTMEVEIKWGIHRIASIFDVQIDYHDRWGWHGILHLNSYEGQILNTHQSCFPGEAGTRRSVGVSHFKYSSNEFFTRENICYKIMSDVLAGVIHFILQ